MFIAKNPMVERASQEETDFPRHIGDVLPLFIHHEEVSNFFDN